MSQTVFHNPAGFAEDPVGKWRLITVAELNASRDPALAIALFRVLNPEIWMEGAYTWRAVKLDQLPFRESATYRTGAGLNALEDLAPPTASLEAVIAAFHVAKDAFNALGQTFSGYLNSLPPEELKRLSKLFNK